MAVAIRKVRPRIVLLVVALVIASWLAYTWPLRGLSVQVSPNFFGPGPSVTVQVYRLYDFPPFCYRAPAELAITVDGQPLRMVRQGGKQAPIEMSGIEVGPPTCAGAIYAPAPGAVFEARPTSVTRLELGWRSAEMITRELFTRRSATISPGPRVRAGDRVVLTWQPESDRWSGYDLSTRVSIFAADGKQKTIESGRGLNVDTAKGQFSFVMPAVAVGRARLMLSPVYLRAEPRIEACRGLLSCESSSAGSPQLDLEVVD